MANSKKLSKWDEGWTLLLQELLWNSDTGGFNIDSIYCVNWDYTVIEFLKNENPKVTPYTSHPCRYWYNKQKFISLWDMTQKLWGKLVLINYETTAEWKIWDRFWVLDVISLDKSKEPCWLVTKLTELNLEWMKKWWKILNDASLAQ